MGYRRPQLRGRGPGLALASAALGILAACPASEPGTSASAGVADAAVGTAPRTPARKVGQIRVDDVWVDVGEFIGHEPKMDLFAACQKQRDEQAKQGSEPDPLCLSLEKRRSFSVLRVEVVAKGGGAAGMAALRDRAEGTHFVIERSGNVWQVLDLAYPVRRDGEYRRHEVRVLSAGKGVHKALVEAFEEVYPGLKVEMATAPAPSPRPPAPAPPAAAPPPPAPPAVKPSAPPGHTPDSAAPPKPAGASP